VLASPFCSSGQAAFVRSPRGASFTRIIGASPAVQVEMYAVAGELAETLLQRRELDEHAHPA
jgi:hypothetical protein